MLSLKPGVHFADHGGVFGRAIALKRNEMKVEIEIYVQVGKQSVSKFKQIY